jgi:hypothetical protein
MSEYFTYFYFITGYVEMLFPTLLSRDQEEAGEHSVDLYKNSSLFSFVFNYMDHISEEETESTMQFLSILLSWRKIYRY